MRWNQPIVGGPFRELSAGIRRYKGGRVKKRLEKKLSDANRLEALAKLVHESGRKAVELGQVVNNLGLPFMPWEELTPNAQAGRRLMAKYLLDKRRRKAVRRLFA